MSGGGEVRKVSPEDIQMVQNLIEQCLPHYMSQKQVVNALYHREQIEPSFTELVWQKLEEQNPEFFRGYYLRWMVKEQITEFNKLLERQVSAMHRVDPSGAPFHTASRRQHGGGFSGVEGGGGGSGQGGRMDVPPSVVLGSNPNLGMMQAVNEAAVKTEAGYLDGSRFVYGGADGGPTGRSSSFGRHGVDYDSSFGLLGSMSQNFGLPDLTVDFPNSSEILDFSRPDFLSSDGDNFLDTHNNTVQQHQGDNKRSDGLSGNLHFEDFGRDL